jgi:hypothetical protein
MVPQCPGDAEVEPVSGLGFKVGIHRTGREMQVKSLQFLIALAWCRDETRTIILPPWSFIRSPGRQRLRRDVVKELVDPVFGAEGPLVGSWRV